MYYIFLIIFVLIFLFIKNIYSYLRIKVLRCRYEKYLLPGNNTFEGMEIEVEQLIKSAGVRDSIVPQAKSIGYGRIQERDISALNNMLVKETDIIQAIMRMFRKAEQIYKIRAIRCINPFYWIDFVFFLPKHILSYLGYENSFNLFKKCTQFIYWFVCTLCVIFFDELLKDLLFDILKL